LSSWLEDAGLSLGAETEEYSDTVPTGNVISQNPAAEMSVAPATEIDLVLSKGPKPTGGCFGASFDKSSSDTPWRVGDLGDMALLFAVVGILILLGRNRNRISTGTLVD
jgi:hypothetical protein